MFWDVVQCRPRKEFAAQVLGAAFENLIRVLVTQEFLNELERTRRSGGSDPALEFALQLPVLRLPPEDLLNQLVLDLAALIFPSRANSSALSVHDRSDLVHLATAVHHEAAGFVTSEEGLIKKRDRIYGRYGVDVIHVTYSASGLQSCRQRPRVLQTHLSGETVRIWNLMPSSSDRVKEFIQRTAPDAAAREEFTVSLGQQNQKSSIVTSDGDIVCLASWEANAGLNNRVRLRVLAEQDHPAAEAALDCLLDRVTSDSSKIAPVVLTLTTRPGDSVVTNAALLHGFDRQSEEQPNALEQSVRGQTCLVRQLASDCNVGGTMLWPPIC